MKTTILSQLAFGILIAVLFSGPSHAQTALSPAKEDTPEAQKIYSPYVERTAVDKNFAEGLYWGDTHLHTGYSSDSGMIGNKLGPDEAYRFAKGEEVISSTGQGPGSFDRWIFWSFLITPKTSGSLR